MQIDYNILIAYGGIVRRIDKGAFIFHEGAMPHFYYQVVKGEIQLFSTNTEGKGLIQGVFNAGQSFGEPPLLLDKCYPSTAQAMTNSVIIKITRDKLLQILKDYPEMINNLLYTFAGRLYHKATSVQMWIGPKPEDKIACFLNRFKRQMGCSKPEVIPYTRQQIADFTGLRVETVIRTLMRMHKNGKVKIIDHKLYY